MNGDYQADAIGASTTNAASAMLVRADRLVCNRGGRIVFAPVSFTLHSGQALLVSGSNGAGKSSLIRMIAGLLQPAGGTLSIDAPITMQDERLALDESRTLRDALSFWGQLDHLSARALEQVLDRLSLSHLAAVPVRMLSTGQRKRAALARVVASGARVWLLDEPGNGLDAQSLAQLSALIRDHLMGGGALIAASHFPLDIDFSQEIALTPPQYAEDQEPVW